MDIRAERIKYKEEIERLDKIHEEMFGESYISEETINLIPQVQIREMKECIRKKKPCWELFPTDDCDY